MKRLLLFVVFGLLYLACSHDDSTESQTYSEFIGTWNWRITSGGIGNNISVTPTSSEHNYRLEIGYNNRIKVFKDQTLLLDTTYQIHEENSIFSTDLMPYITVDVGDNFTETDIVLTGVIQILNTAELGITQNAYDGIGSSFTKVN